jgi:hypothetical protein
VATQIIPMVYKIHDALVSEEYALLPYSCLILLLLIMHITSCFVAALLGGSALAACPAGPYDSGSLCSKSCSYNDRCATAHNGWSNWRVRSVDVVIYTAITAATLSITKLRSNYSISALRSKHPLIVV